MGRASNSVRRILVVEDEPHVGRVCARTLRAEGFGVDVVGNGKDALNVLREKEYDLCLIDIITPEMNGIALYQKLEKEYPEYVNKVIFTTGDVLSGNIKAFLDESNVPYMLKPFTPDELRAIVTTVLGLNQVVLGKEHVFKRG